MDTVKKGIHNRLSDPIKRGGKSPHALSGRTAIYARSRARTVGGEIRLDPIADWLGSYQGRRGKGGVEGLGFVPWDSNSDIHIQILGFAREVFDGIRLFDYPLSGIS